MHGKYEQRIDTYGDRSLGNVEIAPQIKDLHRKRI